jgi:hypothetical protein
MQMGQPRIRNYTDNVGSGSTFGTPALIIPNNFWGIEGVNRGATGGSTPTPGTFLSVCTGSGTPVSGCTTAFPQRTFQISNITVTSGTPTTMVVTVSGTLTSGSNVYPSELAMVRGITASGILAYNGSYRIQQINAGGSNRVTFYVPSTFPTTGCTTNCGTLIFGTPILGFAPRAGNSYNSQSCSGNCSSFGQHIMNLGFNCQGSDQESEIILHIDGCIGWQNLYAQEESGADTFLIQNYNFLGFDSHGVNAQNFGPITNAEILTGGTNSDCDYGTTGAYIDGIAMRGFDHWTINTPVETGSTSTTTCANTPRAALMLDAENTETSQGHCENFADCVLVGANNPGTSGNSASGIHVTGIAEVKPKTYGVEISNINAGLSDFVLENIQVYHGFSTPTVRDDINNITLMNQFVSLYSWSNNAGTGALNLVTTDNEIRNQFGSGIQTSVVATGVAASTDLAGQFAVSGTSTTQSLTGPYTNHPECSVTPFFNPGAGNSMWITYPSATSFTVHFNTTVSGTVSYSCIARN